MEYARKIILFFCLNMNVMDINVTLTVLYILVLVGLSSYALLVSNAIHVLSIVNKFIFAIFVKKKNF